MYALQNVKTSMFIKVSLMGRFVLVTRLDVMED